VIDPQKKARDDDRDAAIEVVEAAFADGQISRPDYDLRVDRLLRAATVGELQMLVRDLRRPEGEEVTEAVEQVTEDVAAPPFLVGPPRINANAVKLIAAVVVAVVALALVVPLVLFARVDGQDSVISESVEFGESVDLTSAEGYDELVREVEAKSGSTTVFGATIYPGYAVIEVPVDADSQRSFGYYYDGDWQDWTGKGKATQERLDLGQIDGSTVASLVRKVARKVEDPTTYVIVNGRGGDEGVCLSAYATNDFTETAYLDARCDGTVVFSYVSE
jgi:hypothetical protein